MKKYGSIIALLVVIVLAILVVTTREKPVEKIKAPHAIKKVEKLNRIELVQAGEKGGLVVLSYGELGWSLTKPVEAPVAGRMSDLIAGALAKKISTDDIKLDPAKLDEFGLGDDAAVKVSLFAEGAEVPAAEFFIGKTFTVEGTRAKRTYIKTADGKVYRAQTDLGEVLGKPLDQLRSKVVQKVDRAAVDTIWVKYQDESKNLQLEKKADKWGLKSPVVNYELERNATSGVLNGFSNLVATGFVDDKTPVEAGLDPWYAKVTGREAGEVRRSILISEPKDGKANVMFEGGKHIFEITANIANQLAVSPLSLRSRLAKNIPVDKVNRVDFGGEAKLSVQKDGIAWTFARGAEGAVKASALMPKLTAIAQLRALRFETPTLDEAGLSKPADKVVLTTNDGVKHTLLIGIQADKKGNLWAKWADMDLIMVVPQWIKERGGPKAEELAETEG